MAILQTWHARTQFTDKVRINGLYQHIIALGFRFAEYSAAGINDFAVAKEEQVVHAAERIRSGDENIVFTGVGGEQ